MTSDGSALEERIRLLKQQLQQKKEEMKKFQTEQRRKKKDSLRQQEEWLKKKVEVWELDLIHGHLKITVCHRPFPYISA